MKAFEHANLNCFVLGLFSDIERVVDKSFCVMVIKRMNCEISFIHLTKEFQQLNDPSVSCTV